MTFIYLGYIFLFGIIAIQSILIFRGFQKSKPASPYVSPQQTSDEKYRDLFENANDAIFVLDKDQNYIDVNRRAIELFGFSKEEFLCLNVMDVIPPEQIDTSGKEFTKLLDNGKYEKFVGKQKTKDGRWLDIEVNSSVILKEGNVVGSRDIVRDITARKKAENEKEALIRDLQNALKEIKTLKGILPLCSFCKKIRDEKGDWKPVDEYIHNYSGADISHTVCSDCLTSNFPKESEKLYNEK